MAQNQVTVLPAGSPVPDSDRVVQWPNWDLHKLSQAHYEILYDRSPLVIVGGGRDSGKDHILALRFLMIVFELFAERKLLPKTRLGPVVVAWVVGPVKGNLDGIKSRFIDLLPDIKGVAPNGNNNIHWRGDDLEIFGTNEILIQFCSGKVPANSRGNGVDVLLYTECSFERERTIKNSFFPLARGRSGYSTYVMLNSTPGEKRGCWWDYAIEQARAGKGDWVNWKLFELSKYDNPILDDTGVATMEAAKSTNLNYYLREYMGWTNLDVPPDSYVNGDALNIAFRPDLIMRLLVATRMEFVGPYYCGADLAGSGPDHFVVVIIDGNGIICEIQRHSKTSVEHILSTFDDVYRRYRPRWIAYDANGRIGKDTRGRLDALLAQPILTSGTQAKTDQILHLEQHMLAGSIHLPHPELWQLEGYSRINQKILLQELQEYCCWDLVSEIVKNSQVESKIIKSYGKPPGGTDDILDALRYCVAPMPVPTLVHPLGESAQDRDARRRRLESARVGVPW